MLFFYYFTYYDTKYMFVIPMSIEKLKCKKTFQTTFLSFRKVYCSYYHIKLQIYEDNFEKYNYEINYFNIKYCLK